MFMLPGDSVQSVNQIMLKHNIIKEMVNYV